jgi:hypothetical protein
MSNIQPLNQNFKLVDQNGFPTVEGLRYFTNLLQRVGGITGGTYTQLRVASGGFIWDLNASPVSYVTLNATGIVPSIINPVAGLLYPYRLQLIQDGTGSRTVAWPATVKWASGAAPTLSTGAGALDEIWFSSDGTNLYGVTGALNLH